MHENSLVAEPGKPPKRTDDTLMPGSFYPPSAHFVWGQVVDTPYGRGRVRTQYPGSAFVTLDVSHPEKGGTLQVRYTAMQPVFRSRGSLTGEEALRVLVLATGRKGRIIQPESPAGDLTYMQSGKTEYVITERFALRKWNRGQRGGWKSIHAPQTTSYLQSRFFDVYDLVPKELGAVNDDAYGAVGAVGEC